MSFPAERLQIRVLLLAALATVAPGMRSRHPSSGPPTKPRPGVASDEQLEWLVAHYGPTLYKVAVAITHSSALAEEAVQDALVQAWSSMPSWDDEVPIKWMRRVVRNRAISIMRKESRSVHDDDWDLRTSPEPDVERLVEGRHVVNAVDTAMQALDQESRLMLVLRETEDVSYDELGEMLGLTTSAVKAKLYRARHALKVELREWGF